MNRIELGGCRAEPLAGYLKALGVLRIVSEQVDPRARGAWIGGRFVLDTQLSPEDLATWLVDGYAPTPVITPWNGGSGFWEGDNQKGIASIAGSNGARFAPYREAIASTRAFVSRSGLVERPDGKQKTAFVGRLRAILADDVLPWMDAALVFGRDSLLFPPLLGTGGNDGRLDFANNFMQRLAEELLDPRAMPRVPLAGALFGGATPGLGDAAVGQFFPSAAGGANGGEGFQGAVGTNPWDFILLVEGTLGFATAMVRRLESGDPGAMTFPFSVRSTAAGFGTAAGSESDSSRDELWLPLWSAPAGWREISTVFREGRSRVGRRAAVTGTDFARALATLGVDRGISAFTRYGFHVRNGLAYQAVPIGRWPVATGPVPVAALLDEIDRWLVGVARAGGEDAPARMRTAVRHLDDAILAAVRPGAGPGDIQRLLVALADLEASAADSREHGGLREGVPVLDGARWIPLLEDGTPEFDLAASIAPSLRTRWSNVRAVGDRRVWADGADRQPPSARTWRRGPLELRLLDLLERERVEAGQHGAGPSFDRDARWYASLPSVTAFLDGRTDDARIVELSRALSLLSWPGAPGGRTGLGDPPFLFACARLLVGGSAETPKDELPFPPVAGWLAAARRDDGPRFTSLTWRRLASSGVRLRGLDRRSRPSLLRAGEDLPVRRVAAACRFPLSAADLALLLDTIQHASTETP